MGNDPISREAGDTRRDAERRAALATRLQQLRTARGLSAVQLAAAAGLDPDYYQDVERGRGDLDLLTALDLMDLADALGLTVAGMLSDMPGEPPPPGTSPTHQGADTDVAG